MFNLKLTIGSAAFGLIASFLLGLLGGNLLYIVLLRSLLCAAIMGGAMTLASFVFNKFLADGASDSSTYDSGSSTGSLVDITISEDVLPDSDNAPDFYVAKDYTKTHSEQQSASFNSVEQSSFKASAVESVSSNAETARNNSNTFIPTPLAQEKYSTNVSNNSAPITDVPNSQKQQSFSEASFDSLDSLDSLPEMKDVFSDSKPQNDEVIEDSAFATGEATPSADFVPDVAMGADASLMAEAIKTLLKREG